MEKIANEIIVHGYSSDTEIICRFKKPHDLQVLVKREDGTEDILFTGQNFSRKEQEEKEKKK